ncbi:alpha/beta hydrolase [Cohnella pontilimi]|uniref:Alpha/beta hydrolase n=1 Tax=Cohnella pontilimi TaxID=2564100 RepID=A0A4U0FET9_9BACL|nr:alpha/beta hydrolase [Cohnella pontilimi]TJY42854.1 alpha/beta hydrolase [Cohnella pontilimi]
MKDHLPFNPAVHLTIQKTLMTSLLFEGFWDRWIAHGMEKETVAGLRRKVKGVEDWVEYLAERARSYESQAEAAQDELHAEHAFRMAGLHYNLAQWIYPEAGVQKKHWFSSCTEAFDNADRKAEDTIRKVVFRLDDKLCIGRIRKPERPRGCVVILTPMDSSKEELFSYETDFARLGFAAVSFDGPGQGETYLQSQLKMSRQTGERFVNRVIEFAAAEFPGLGIYLFGTSSGAAWAIWGSRHPKVSKAVSVSPALESDVPMPDYFTERLSYLLEEPYKRPLPDMRDVGQSSPVFLFHGNRDVMVKDEQLHALYDKLPQGKRLVEYEDEGHCCNFKLHEIRQLSAHWFLEDEK